ncbi:MAG: hypothetical protein GY738_05635 [Pseudoalteromonas sp.]|nr:hypothetical protein [Pseudoalteromonas sp.]
MKFLILVVLFNKRFSQSSSIQSLLNKVDFDFTLYIWDNSNDISVLEENRADSLNIENFIYYTSSNNEPLSKVYNKVLRENVRNYNFFVILDDDTFINDSYIDCLKSLDEKHLVAVPKVYSADKMISPGRIQFVKGQEIGSIQSGVIDSKNITAIMSATIINSRYVLNSLKSNGFIFDERLSFYSVDTMFFKTYRTENESIYVLDCHLEHSSALRSDLDLSERLRRYENLYNSWKVVYSDSKMESILIRLFVFYSVLKSVLKYRSFKFFRCL